MKNYILYILTVSYLFSCKGFSQEDKNNLSFINKGVEMERYEIISLTSKGYRLLPIQDLPKQFNEYYEQYRERLPILGLYKNYIVFIPNNTTRNILYLEKYDIKNYNIDTLNMGGKIFNNGTIINKYGTTNWLLTGDRKYYPVIEYTKDNSLPNNKTLKDLLQELYQKSEATDYSSFEFRFYIPPTWYIVENREEENITEEEMEELFPLKKGTDIELVDFKFPVAQDKYYQELEVENHTYIPDYLIKEAKEEHPDNKDKQKNYIDLRIVPYTRIYAEIQMPKETIQFKYENAIIQFFGNEELYEKGIILFYLSSGGISEQEGLYLIRPKH